MNEGTGRRWLILLAQLPASPSSARVSVWRRLRAAGAVSLMNGASALPESEPARALFSDLAKFARSHGGHAFVFEAGCDPVAEAEITNRLREDRRGEYAELDERSAAFIAEVEKERVREKFTFAELEELEDDVDKLQAWLAKIKAREFAPGEALAAAELKIAECTGLCDAFAAEVYARAGIEPQREA